MAGLRPRGLLKSNGRLPIGAEMGVLGKASYLRRVVSAYLTSRGSSQLSFWHESPELNTDMQAHHLGPYYMGFASKASYGGPFDDAGIPLLDYRGALGKQYNPIAIAQYGLAHFNCLNEPRAEASRDIVVRVADWLTDNLVVNDHGLHVWMHHFNWEYRNTLMAPWYSGLAQGQGISLLLRAQKVTGDPQYLETAAMAMQSLYTDVSDGGVIYRNGDGVWIEEYIVNPPTHILNGFIWASWGVWDYYLATKEERAKQLFEHCVSTIESNLHRYDIGWWSLYEQSGTRLRMIASPFYHRLHIVQLGVMEKLTGEGFFGDYTRRWEGYEHSWIRRRRAFITKALFKIVHY